eukprot:TRINITY_DN4741_c0_g1_i2.p1 TRINITY_DN4741_c0_g1~~TRINITY_DN4741_c0_g1_i2.p1  ORF type:complete len:434 (-),score=96.74 TRINITY_DN4741_c0_g1_i2:196-1497(-)
MTQSSMLTRTNESIVGGGLSGLNAANTLLRQSVSNFVVLEGVGGRTSSTSFGQAGVDLGGQYVGPLHTRMLALAKEMKVPLHTQFSKGKKIVDFGGKISTYSSEIPSLSIPVLIDTEILIRKINHLASTIVVAHPEKSPNAKVLDSMTVASWLDKHAWTEGAKKLCGVVAQAVWAAEPEEMSMLYFLWYCKQNGSFDFLVKIENGAQQWCFPGGTQQFSEYLASKIGNRLRLGVAVRKIEKIPDGLAVYTRSSPEPILARRVILAIPLAIVLQQIEFQEGLLSPKKLHLLQRVFMGSSIKIIAIYSSAFWREQGFSGEVICDCHTGPIGTIFDDMLAPREGGSHTSALLGFISGRVALELSSEPDDVIRRKVTDQLVRYFGAEAAKPLRIELKKINTEEFSGGGPTSLYGPGVLTATGDTFFFAFWKNPLGCD